MIFNAFIWKGKLYVVTENGWIFRLDTKGSSTPGDGWTWVALGSLDMSR